MKVLDLRKEFGKVDCQLTKLPDWMHPLRRCKGCGKKTVLTNEGLCYDCLDIDRQ